MSIPPFKATQDATTYNSAAAVTPSDSANLPLNPTRGIYIGVAGDFKATMEDATTATFSNLPVGVYPFKVQRVFATGTAATNIVALY